MSESDDGPGRREVAHRLFATEYDDASLEFSESDEERAPNYVVTPTGARVNRLFVVGVLTAVEPVNEETVRARVVDPTGAFVIYAGQYQPDELAFFERADPPTFVAITGKANAFSPDDSDRVLTSVRPESVNEVDEDTRDRWVVTTAEQTLSRIGVIADALDRPERGDELAAFLRANGIDHATASGVALALDHYDTGPDYLGVLRNVALDAARVVAGETDEVRELDLEPATRQGEFDPAVLAERSPTGPVVEATEAASADRVDDTGESGSASADGEAGTVSEDAGDAATTPGSDEEAGTVSADAEASGNDEEAGTVSADAEASGDDEEASTVSADAEASGDDEEASTAAGGEETATSTTSSAHDGGETATAADADDTEPTAGSDVAASSDEPAESTASTGTASTGGSSLENFDDGTAADNGSGEPSASEASTSPETDEMYEFDEEEREQIQEEHGLEFSTGSEVDAGGTGEAAQGTDPGREDAETASEQVDDAAAGGTEGNDSEAETPAEEESTTVADDGDDADDRGDGDDADDRGDGDDADDDADLDEVLLDRMAALDDGDGADRSALVDAVVEAIGVSEADVEDAIEDALMSGQCYEPDDETLKPI